jgi:uncharacterized caspase-like protein
MSNRVTIIRMIVVLAAMVALLAGIPSLSAQNTSTPGGTRIALVVGNSAYQHVSPLTNPVNDAADMGATLENLGFSVSRVLDGSKGDLERAIRDFQSAASRPGTELAMFYYAGHGVEHEGINYLIPVTAQINDEYELMDQAVNVTRVTQAMDRGQAEFNMVVLDACRDNPFFRTRSAGSRGLAAMSGGGKGSMIVFATSPGDVAQDGDGRNSPFTQAFMEHAPVPGVEVSTLMRRVNGTVQELTGGRQTPWFNASYTGEVYLSAAERLADASARTDAINDELAALEAEIARRQEAISAAANREERERLEAEQQRARAEETAKRLQAEQLAQIEAQARRVLEQRRADEALRAQMEEELSAQRVSLTRQAEERRAQLEDLRRAASTDDDIWQQLETIANVNRAITDIEERFAATISRTTTEINQLYDSRVAAVRENNPKEPRDTDAEYEEIIIGLTAEIEAERTAELERRRSELEANQVSELSELRAQLSRRKDQLNGRTFSLGASATEVHVARFNAEEKRFPIEVRAAEDNYTFAVPLSYTIDSQDRSVLREEYYRVFSADQSGGLAGEITYTVFELYPNIWVLQPIETRVVNLLEDDTELAFTAAAAGEMVVSTADRVVPVAGIVRFESSRVSPAEVRMDGRTLGTTDLVYSVYDPDELGTSRFEYRWSDGTRRVVAVNMEGGVNESVTVIPGEDDVQRRKLVLFTGIAGETEISLGQERVVTQPGAGQAVVSAPSGFHGSLEVSGRWLSQRYEEDSFYVPDDPLSPAIVNVSLADHNVYPVGRIEVTLPAEDGARYAVNLIDAEGRQIAGERLSQPAVSIPAPPGEYHLAVSRHEDPYISLVQPVSVALERVSTFQPAEVPLSARFRLETAQAEHGAVEKQISRKGVRRVTGWSLPVAGAAAFGGAGYSYLQGQDAISAYDDANTTAGVSDARADAAQWGLYFNIGAIAGAVSSAVGTGVLTLGPGRGALIEQRNELDQQINRYSAEYARLQAESALYGREM